MDDIIYLDNNATTPIDPIVAKTMQPYLFNNFGNPSSSHYYGVKARVAIEKARGQVASLLDCGIDEVIFTSGGTESNNYAIKGFAFANREKGNHIVTTSIEHPAVTEVCKYLETQGFEISYLPVDEFGIVKTASVIESITKRTILISIMHANNEVGSIQPIKEIADIAHNKGVVVHSDCAQSVGKIPVNVNKLAVDMLSMAGHKFYAPKGVGALYVKSGIKLDKFVHGADHELNRRAGTENVLEIVGFGKACELVEKNLDKYANNMKVTRDILENELKRIFPAVKFNGSKNKRLPNTLSVSFKGIEANTILSELNSIAVSAGAACHSDGIDISPTLRAMNVATEFAMGTIRFSTGRYSKKNEIYSAVKEIRRVYKKLKTDESKKADVSLRGNVKLTQFTHGLGCACKLPPQTLEKILKKMPLTKDKNVLIGAESSDDAAVYKINSKMSIIQTVDFFTPIVDDPFDFGAIAASNSLSDIYAMGGKPLFALNIVGFPSSRLQISILQEILEGANSKAAEAGISIIGGHTVDDVEPKYGLAVTGIVESKNVIKNNSCQPGDALILTKPIGTGIYSTALKKGMLSKKGEKLFISTMSELNKSAAEVMQAIGVNACTDVTGFGLLGHLSEMMSASETNAVIEYDRIKFLPNVLELAVAGNIPGGTKENLAYTKPFVKYKSGISDVKKMIMNDAQTSGGLLISVSKNKCRRTLELLKKKGIKASVKIGEVQHSKGPRIEVK